MTVAETTFEENELIGIELRAQKNPGEEAEEEQDEANTRIYIELYRFYPGKQRLIGLTP